MFPPGNLRMYTEYDFVLLRLILVLKLCLDDCPKRPLPAAHSLG